MSHYWDAHCHLLDPRFLTGIDAVIQRAVNEGITHFWLGGVSPADWDLQIQLQERLKQQMPSVRIVESFGLHPWYVSQQTEAQLEVDLQHLTARAATATTLGEMGLDFHPARLLSQNPPEVEKAKRIQEAYFLAQLKLATRLQKPVVIHLVQAHQEALRILNGLSTRVRGIVHSFHGSLELAQSYQECGLLVSLSARVIRTESPAARALKLLQGLHDDAFVVETDSPDQSFAGGLNEPTGVWTVAERIAKIRGTSAEKILDASRRNLEKLLQCQA